MNTAEKETIAQYLRRIEMYMPPAWTLKYGEWNTFKTLIEDLVDELDELEEADKDKEVAERDLEELKESIDGVCTDLEDAIEEGADTSKFQEILDELKRLK